MRCSEILPVEIQQYPVNEGFRADFRRCGWNACPPEQKTRERASGFTLRIIAYICAPLPGGFLNESMILERVLIYFSEIIVFGKGFIFRDVLRGMVSS